MLTHKQLKALALKRPEVKAEYDRLNDEFEIMDELLRLRFSAGSAQTGQTPSGTHSKKAARS